MTNKATAESSAPVRLATTLTEHERAALRTLPAHCAGQPQELVRSCSPSRLSIRM